jgi:DNA-binding beta-propeller fold protein YncE
MTFTTDPRLFESSGSEVTRNGNAIEYVCLNDTDLPPEEKNGAFALVTADNDYYEDAPPGVPYEADDLLVTDTNDTRSNGTNDIWMTFDGTRFYEVDNQFGNERIFQFTLSTPYDVGTKSYDGAMVPQFDGSEGMDFNNDGSKVYVITASDNRIEEQDLSTNFDVTTNTFAQSIPTQDNNPRGVRFSNDGTKLFEVGTDNNGTIYESNLTVPFDISTAIFSQSISSVDPRPNAIEFKPDGTKMYIATKDDGDLNQFALSTPYDISTANFELNFDLVGNAAKTGIIWRDNGERFYNSNDNRNDVRSYELNTGGWTRL